MKHIMDNDTIQIEITNACHNQCSNCTRACGHHAKPYFMSPKDFETACKSLEGFPKMIGMMGGEPLLHPQFEELCGIMRNYFPRHKTGLWTCLPAGKEHLREVIVATFGHIFINDHTREDIMHGPVLVASKELPGEQWEKDYTIHHCWAQRDWSASINPTGAWFCEIAASLSNLLGIGKGWEVKPGWYKKAPKDYVDQMKMCNYCGLAMPLKKRKSTETTDDISPEMFKKLQFSSPKLKAGKYQIHDLKYETDCRPMQTYKDIDYRDQIAKKYGLFLMINEMGFQTPFLSKSWSKP
jgi:hypothetical protein